MTAVEAAADAAFVRRLDPAAPAPVAVALSGGGDSVALLKLAAAWARRSGRPVLAITVDHGLNADSKAWSVFAAEAARRAGAGWLGLEWRGAKPATGLPAAARAARHRLLAEGARAAGARVILTGHTLDDLAEGDWMRTAESPGLGRLREWAPSPAWPEGRGLFLLRPLLGVRREALRDWLRARGEAWIDDPANADPRFTRARARAALAASTPLAAPEPSGWTAAAGPGAAFEATPDGRIVLSRKGLDGALLSAALLCAAGTGRPPRGLRLAGLLNRLAGETPVDATLAGARLVADTRTIQIGRDAGERFRGGLAPLPLPEGAPIVWDGRFELVADGPGLQAAPLGGAIARLGRADRARLKALPAWARGAAPALIAVDGGVGLPRPLGEGRAHARALAGRRLAAACGLIARESEIDDRPHSAGAVITLCSDPIP